MPASKVKLLIVDDEPLILEIITSMLAICTYDIKGAYDGAEAVAIAKEFHPDCVVTGIMMPKMDGLQEAAAILQFQPTCKFVFVTTIAYQPEIRQEYERLGLDLRLLLPKPFPRPDLLNALALAGFPCSGAS
jgi:CheY-like chemotaxis protein